jgi:hypothetical protein
MQLNNIRLDDGFSTTIELENIPTVKLYEKEITPPNISGGGPIETTTMRNLAWRTKSPKKLKAMGNISTTCAYATDAIPVLFAQIGVNQRMTVTFADGAHLRLWGWLDEFTPGAFTEGEQPTATVVFVPSLHNNSGVEVAPEYIQPLGDTAGDSF